MGVGMAVGMGYDRDRGYIDRFGATAHSGGGRDHVSDFVHRFILFCIYYVCLSKRVIIIHLLEAWEDMNQATIETEVLDVIQHHVSNHAIFNKFKLLILLYVSSWWSSKWRWCWNGWWISL